MDTTTTGDIVAHVATDNYKGGQLAGEYIAKKILIDKKGKVAIVTYSEIEACVKREEGFKEVISKYSDIKLLDVQNCSGSAEKAANVTQDMFAYSDEIVHPFRRKASTRSGSNRPAVPVEIVRLFQAKSSTCSGSKNPVVSASPVDQVGAKRRAA